MLAAVVLEAAEVLQLGKGAVTVVVNVVEQAQVNHLLCFEQNVFAI